MPDMTKDQAMAYIAGLLDGEGHYGIAKVMRPSGFIFRPVVAVGMTHKPTILWLQSNFGGSVSFKPPTEKHEAQAAWTMRGRAQLLSFLPEMSRFARLKKVHVLLLLDFVQLFPKCTSTVWCAGPDLPELTKYYEIMKALNAKGPGSSDLKEQLSKVLTLVGT